MQSISYNPVYQPSTGYLKLQNQQIPNMSAPPSTLYPPPTLYPPHGVSSHQLSTPTHIRPWQLGAHCPCLLSADSYENSSCASGDHREPPTEGLLGTLILAQPLSWCIEEALRPERICPQTHEIREPLPLYPRLLFCSLS